MGTPANGCGREPSLFLFSVKQGQTLRNTEHQEVLGSRSRACWPCSPPPSMAAGPASSPRSWWCLCEVTPRTEGALPLGHQAHTSPCLVGDALGPGVHSTERTSTTLQLRTLHICGAGANACFQCLLCSPRAYRGAGGQVPKPRLTRPHCKSAPSPAYHTYICSCVLRKMHLIRCPPCLGKRLALHTGGPAATGILFFGMEVAFLMLMHH